MNKKRIKHKRRNKNNAGKKYSHLPGLVLIILLGVIIYSNSFDCSFHMDDKSLIIENTRIHDISDIQSIWKNGKTRFIPYYTLALNYHFGQEDVWGYHLFNLGVHLITACLLYWLTLLIFSSPVFKDKPIARHKKVLALFTALLFVSHPLATQSVTYIIQRMAAIVTLFYILSLVLYVKARLTDAKSRSQYLLFGGAIIAAICAFMSKPNGFTLPFAIVLVEICFFRIKKFSLNLKDYRTIIPLAALVGFTLIVLFNYSFSIFEPDPPKLQNDFRTISSSNYLLTQFSVIVKYIQLLILPIQQNVDYDWTLSTSLFEARTLLSFLFLLSLVMLGVFLFKKNRIVSFGIFWFFLTLSIESSVIPLSDLIFEHRTYLPSFGFFLILSTLIYSFFWEKYRSLALVLFIGIIGVNSFLTFERNKVWKTEYSFWNDAVQKSPNKGRPYMQRGLAFAAAGQHQQAIQDYNKAIELRPGFYKTHNNRGEAYKALQRYPEALNDFNKAIELKPDYALAYNNVGTIYMLQSRFGEAIVELEKAIHLKPGFSQAFANRGITYLNLGDREKGCTDLRKSVELGFNPAKTQLDQYCQ